MSELYSPENFQQWQTPPTLPQRLDTASKEENEFAQKLKNERPELRLKEMLDVRRKSLRWAIGFHSAARLLGVDPKTLRAVSEDPYRTTLELIRPQGNRGHRYLWLDDVLEFALRMSEAQ